MDHKNSFIDRTLREQILEAYFLQKDYFDYQDEPRSTFDNLGNKLKA